MSNIYFTYIYIDPDTNKEIKFKANNILDCNNDEYYAVDGEFSYTLNLKTKTVNKVKVNYLGNVKPGVYRITSQIWNGAIIYVNKLGGYLLKQAPDGVPSEKYLDNHLEPTFPINHYRDSIKVEPVKL